MAYKYYLLYRPPSIGTHPSGEVEREVWMPAHEIHNVTGLRALGWVSYNQSLTFDQLFRFELWPADETEEANYILSQVGEKARAHYLTMPVEELNNLWETWNDAKFYAALFLRGELQEG